MKSSYKLPVIIVLSILAVLLGGMVYTKSVTNNAISYEEDIHQARANVGKEEKRRADLFINMVDAIESYNQYEGDTMEKIVEARTSAQSGDVEEAAEKLSVVVEQYPELKAQENYQSAIKEFSITENRLASTREDYNGKITNYKRFVRKWPNSTILAMQGYEVQSYKLLEFNDIPEVVGNLFGK